MGRWGLGPPGHAVTTLGLPVPPPRDQKIRVDVRQLVDLDLMQHPSGQRSGLQAQARCTGANVKHEVDFVAVSPALVLAHRDEGTTPTGPPAYWANWVCSRPHVASNKTQLGA